MKPVPETDNAIVLRTDFRDSVVWSKVRAEIEAPVGEFRAYVEFIDDREYANMDWEEFAGNVDEDGVFRGYPE